MFNWWTRLPENLKTGFGPRYSAFIAEMSGPKGLRRLSVQNQVRSIIEIHISTCAIGNFIDRGTNALIPIYQRIAEVARSSHEGVQNSVSAIIVAT